MMSGAHTRKQALLFDPEEECRDGMTNAAGLPGGLGHPGRSAPT